MKNLPALLILSMLAFQPGVVSATPPDAPILATNTYKQRLQASWSKPDGAVTFRFYFAPAPALDTWRSVNLGTKQYAAIDLPVGAAYGISITAVNGNGEESEFAAVQTFEITASGDLKGTRNPVIYFATSDTSSDWFRDVGISITLESSEKAIYAYDVAGGELEEVWKINSPSYASSTIRPLSMDGRIFTTRYWSGTEYYEFREIGGDGTADYFTADAVKDCFAVVGDSLYFSEARARDFYGNLLGEGGFRELRLPDTNTATHNEKGTIVFDEGADDESCGSNMTSSAGVIYDATWYGDDDYISLIRRDPVTLEREELFFSFADISPVDGFELAFVFAFDDNRAYFVRSHESGIFQVWEYEFGGSAANMVYLIDDDRFRGWVPYMDAEGDYLILGNNQGIGLLIDRRLGKRSYFDMGSFYDLELVVR